jgi:hypothetical protein
MPRGQVKQPGVLSGTLGSEPVQARGRGLAAPSVEETRAAIERDVAAFAQAWFQGDAPAMARCLHPDFTTRLMAVWSGAEVRPDRDPERFVRSVVGLQGTFGSKTAPRGRRLRVRVLDARPRSASAVVELGGWVLHIHLARAEGKWRIVNAMWEMTPSNG